MRELIKSQVSARLDSTFRKQALVKTKCEQPIVRNIRLLNIGLHTALSPNGCAVVSLTKTNDVDLRFMQTSNGSTGETLDSYPWLLRRRKLIAN